MNSWKTELYKYIAGIIKGKEQKSIIVNGMPDHIHVFVGLKPSMAISDLVRDIKNNTSKFVNEHKFVEGKFAWQEGYGAFSYSHSQIGKVYDYILNQEKHHQKKTFKQETLISLRILKSGVMRNICLNGTIKERALLYHRFGVGYFSL